MKTDNKKRQKRYFDAGEEVSHKNESSNSEVEVYNIKITPGLLKKQQRINDNRIRKPYTKEFQGKFPGKAPIDKKKLEKHSRGEGFSGIGVRHPLHLEKLKKRENKLNYAQEQAARAEILLTEEQGFVEVEDDGKTTAISQKIISENVDISTATKIFDLNLDFGPYMAKYSRNGRHLLLGGKKGHLAAFDWVTKKLHCEINVMESIHDVSWLHVETMLAVAQKEWLYIYDNTGIELHCIKKMDKILRMEFLPYHFLLAAVFIQQETIWLYKRQIYYRCRVSSLVKHIYIAEENSKDALGIFCDLTKAFDCVDHEILIRKLHHYGVKNRNEFGFMSWLDISIGEIVGNYNNHMGRTPVMTQNPYNATLCLGNSKGVVSLWAPTVKDPLAKILCHKTPLTAIAVDNKGMYMATSGTDRSLKIWDIRNLDGPLQHYKLRTAPADLEFSQKDMLAVALGDVVEIYDNCCSQTTEKPYLRHRMAKAINNFKFCPYEDVLGVGTNKGFTSIIVPGSGEPNFDALESNPFQTTSQRKEAEVKALLEKVPVELITLNPFEVTEVDVPGLQEQMEAKKKLLYLKPKQIDVAPRFKNKGKTTIARKKIIKDSARREYIEQSIEAKKLLNLSEEQEKPTQSFGVLDRFVPKPKAKK